MKVVLIIGAGSGIGGAIADRFAKGGDNDDYHVCLIRRSNSKGLHDAVQRINNKYNSNNNHPEATTSSRPIASGYLVDITKPGNSIKTLIDKIENEIGPICVCVYNIGAQFGIKTLEETTMKEFKLGWKLGTQGLFRIAKCLLPRMVKRRHHHQEEGRGGTLLVTSSTASVRGNYGQISHTAAMAGRRMICQALNAEFASKGVHVVHVVIDGPVHSPDTLGKMMGRGKFQDFIESRKGEIIDPKAVAETYWHLAHQLKSTWTFELDIRSCVDIPWWNDGATTTSSNVVPRRSTALPVSKL